MRRLQPSTILLAGLLVSAGPPAAGDEARLSEARAVLERGEAAAAVALLEPLRRERPGDPTVAALLGRALARDRRFADAERVLTAAVAGGQRDLETQMALAAATWENGHLARAEAIYRDLAASSDGDPVVLYPLAGLLLWRGAAGEAVPLYAQVRALRPSWTHVGLDFARALEQSGRLEEALAQAAAFVTTFPEHAEGLYTLATILRRLGRREEAGAVLERYRAVQAEDTERTLASGRREVARDEVRSLLARGQAAAALARLEGLPDDIESMRLTARALEALGRADEALRALERAVAEDPGRTDVRVELQEAYRRLSESG